LESHGEQPVRDPNLVVFDEVQGQMMSPADMLATMWHLLGVVPGTELRDRLNRPQVLSHGRVIERLV
jgi:hypothetical protein